MRPPSRRARERLAQLHSEVSRIEAERRAALGRFMASRISTTRGAQEEFWMEFVILSHEFRFAVRNLNAYCDTVLGR